MLRRLRVEHHATTNRLHWRIAADHESITGQHHRRFLKAELHIGFFAGSELIAIEEDHPPHDFTGSGMESDARTVTERPRRIGEML